MIDVKWNTTKFTRRRFTLIRILTFRFCDDAALVRDLALAVPLVVVVAAVLVMLTVAMLFDNC